MPEEVANSGGTPEQVAESPVSYTGRYVKKYLEKREEV